MKIASINQIGNEISIITDTGESAVLYKWGSKGDIYTTVSDGLYKYELTDFKKAIKRTNWNVEQLKREFIK
jgi:hypothetical protein